MAVPSLAVRRLSPAERERALELIVAAFSADPLLRWVWPEEPRWAASSRRLLGLLLDVRLAGGEVWTADDGAAVAMWDPPGGPYAAPGTRAWSLWSDLQAGFTTAERERWSSFESALGERETAPHWYLGVLATDPRRRGQGLATAAVGPVLAAADRTSTAAWLETASAANVDFYARLGFAEVRHVDLPQGPRCWLLRRAPQPPRSDEEGTPDE